MKKTLTLLTVLTVFLAGCDAPFWYKIPDSGNYICDEPYIEYLRSSDGDVYPNAKIRLDGEDIDFNLAFTHTAAHAWLYHGDDEVIKDDDFLFFGLLKRVKDDEFTIKLDKDGDTKAILDDYDYKELVFKKQKEEN